MEPHHDPSAPVPIAPETLDILHRSVDAFYRDLPELLNEHERQWVAYHDDRRLGFGRTESELIQHCKRSGLNTDEVFIMVVDPSALTDDQEIDPPSGAIDWSQDDEMMGRLPPA